MIRGLAAAADEYLTKPFHPRELHARVRVGRIVDLHREVQDKNLQLEGIALIDPLPACPIAVRSTSGQAAN